MVTGVRGAGAGAAEAELGVDTGAAAGDGLRHEPEPVEDILDIPAFLRRQAD